MKTRILRCPTKGKACLPPPLASLADNQRAALRKRSRKTLLFLAAIIVVELIALSISFSVASQNHFPYRVTRQLEMMAFGENRFGTGIYTGDVDFGYAEGQGKYSYATGETYEGSWSNNLIDGLGVLKDPGEGAYEGSFRDGKKDGQGTFTWQDGTVYSGRWEDDRMCGQGTYTGADGVRYSGIFENNQIRDGECSFENDTGRYSLKYKGGSIDSMTVQFAQGARYAGAADGSALSGQGSMDFPNGDAYRGAFESGAREGRGVYTWSNGDVYDGAWHADSMEGSGTYTFSSGNSARGTFRDNKLVEGSFSVKNDFGSYEFTIKDAAISAVEIELADGTVCSSEVKDGKLTGQATIQYATGDKYSGSIEEGRKSGQGVYEWASGARYDGSWGNDAMNGTGTYFYPETDEGYKLEGSFEGGLPQGKCKYFTSTSESFETDWDNGKCVKIYE